MSGPAAWNHAPTLDFEGEMGLVDQELKQWWDGLSVEQQDQVIAMGPPDEHNTGGFLDKNY